MPVEHIAHNPNIINCGFVQLHLKFSENCGDCQKYFSLRESSVPMLMHCYIETPQRKKHVRNANALPRTFAKCDQVLFKVKSLRRIHPPFRDETLRIGEDVFVVVHE
jgi:hypothetical protein